MSRRVLIVLLVVTVGALATAGAVLAEVDRGFDWR